MGSSFRIFKNYQNLSFWIGVLGLAWLDGVSPHRGQLNWRGRVGVNAVVMFPERVGDVNFEPVELAAERDGHAYEFRKGIGPDADGDFIGDLAVDGFKGGGQELELGLLGAENVFFGLFKQEESELVNPRPGALVPMVEGGGGDADLFGDFGN